MKYKYVLFDLDGTITDPFEGITASIIYALDKFGISVSDRDKLAAFIGPPLVESFSKYYGFHLPLLAIIVNIMAKRGFSNVPSMME